MLCKRQIKFPLLYKSNRLDPKEGIGEKINSTQQEEGSDLRPVFDILQRTIKKHPGIIKMKEFIISQDENGHWTVTSEKIPGFIARGKTQQEALEKMKAAFRMYFPCGECKGE